MKTRWRCGPAAGVVLLAAMAGRQACAAQQALPASTTEAQVRALLTRGAAAEAAGDRRGALGAYEAAEALAPGNAEIAVRTGVLLGAAGDPAAAMRQFTHALTLQPDNAEAHYNLGLAEVGAQTQAPQWSDALQQFEAALAQRPQYAESAREAGVCLLALGRPAEAVVRLRAAVAMDEHSAEAHLLLGKALEAQGQIQEALGEDMLAAKLQQPYPEADLRAGSLLLRQGDTHAAQQYLCAALATQPDLQEAHYQLAQALRRVGDRQGALVEMRQVAALAQAAADQVISAHRSNESLDLAKNGKRSDALTVAQQAVTLDPENAVALFNRALLLADSGAFLQAQQELQKAISLAPLQPRFYAMLARVQAAAGWTDAAQHSWQAAQTLDPALPPDAPVARAKQVEAAQDSDFPFGARADTAAAHAAFATYLEAHGDDEGALGELLRAAALAPWNATLRMQVGSARLKLGQTAQAELEFRKAVLMAPGDGRVRLDLAQALSAEGECAEAREELRIAMQLQPGKNMAALRKPCGTPVT